MGRTYCHSTCPYTENGGPIKRLRYLQAPCTLKNNYHAPCISFIPISFTGSSHGLVHWYQAWVVPEGSATIPKHINGFKNHLDSLLESGNQVEILESGINLYNRYLVFLCMALFGKLKSQESIQKSQSQAKIPKIPESC